MLSSPKIAHQQLSCFSSISRSRLCFHTLPAQSPNLRSQVCVALRSNKNIAGISASQIKTSLSFTPDSSTRGHIEVSSNSYTSAEEVVNGKVASESLPEHTAIQEKRTAKIHDFCLGIPYGGIVFIGGLAGFIFTRNLSTLGTGVLFGSALLALSIFSLKVWRQGKSSLPFIIGQSVLAATLLWKNFQTYSMRKKLFPTGFYIFLSAAMICFYSYVVLSGGNPPPKKLKSIVAPS